MSDDLEFDQGTIKAKKVSIRAYKGHVTRTRKEIGILIPHVSGTLSPVGLHNLEMLMDKAQNYYKVENLYGIWN